MDDTVVLCGEAIQYSMAVSRVARHPQVNIVPLLSGQWTTSGRLQPFVASGQMDRSTTAVERKEPRMCCKMGGCPNMS